VKEQKARRGIVKVRTLLPYADPRAESAMESEARLVFLEYGIPPDELQYEIEDLFGDVWRVDFAWPAARIAVEYDSMQWHANADIWRRDRIKQTRLKECGWTVIPIVVDDVRRRPERMIATVVAHLGEALRLAS